MSASLKSDSLDYVVLSEGGRHHVAIALKDSPWRRIIATFMSLDRAQQYCFIENDCFEAHFDTDGEPDQHFEPPEESLVPPPIAEPPSALPNLLKAARTAPAAVVAAPPAPATTIHPIIRTPLGYIVDRRPDEGVVPLGEPPFQRSALFERQLEQERARQREEAP
jgi:hypothetical protein